METKKRSFQAKKLQQNRRGTHINPPASIDEEHLNCPPPNSTSESEIIKFYRRNSTIKDERFADKLILKYNILTLNKQRIVEQIERQPEMGERFISYLANIDSQVQQIQKLLPNPLSSEPDAARGFISNPSDSL